MIRVVPVSFSKQSGSPPKLRIDRLALKSFDDPLARDDALGATERASVAVQFLLSLFRQSDAQHLASPFNMFNVPLFRCANKGWHLVPRGTIRRRHALREQA